MLFVSNKRHYAVIKKYEDKEMQYRERIQELEATVAKLEREKGVQQKIDYRKHFPAKPHLIEVSPLLARTVLKNKVKYHPVYPFGKYTLDGIDIRTNDKFHDNEVRFHAWWDLPPIKCKQCGRAEEVKYAYPSDSPQFCNSTCFKTFMKKGSLVKEGK